jgi:chorismate mutase
MNDNHSSLSNEDFMNIRAKIDQVDIKLISCIKNAGDLSKEVAELKAKSNQVTTVTQDGQEKNNEVDEVAFHEINEKFIEMNKDLQKLRQDMLRGHRELDAKVS